MPNKGTRHNPVTSITVNITPNHRLQGAYHYQAFSNTPDTLNNADARFPGFPAFGHQVSTRTSGSITLRSTLSSAMVNELRGGWQSSPLGFFDNATADMFANQGGFAVGLGFDLTGAHPGGAAGPSQRNTIPYSIDDTFSWLKGSHSMSFGGNFTRLDDWADNWNTVQSIGLGIAAQDPAELAGMFSAANFPGSSNGNRNDARALYALLTGRVTSHWRDGPPERGRHGVHLQRPRSAPRADGRVRALRAGPVALEADAHDHGRLALPAPDADEADQRRVHRHDHRVGVRTRQASAAGLTGCSATFSIPAC